MSRMVWQQACSCLPQQVQRARQRSRSGTVAVAGQGFAQRIYMATVLEQERGCNRSIPRVHVNGGPVLAGVQEDFCQITVLEPPNASGVVDAPMLEAEQLVATPAR